MVFNKDGIEQLAMTVNRTQMEKEKNRQKRKEKQQQQKLKKEKTRHGRHWARNMFSESK